MLLWDIIRDWFVQNIWGGVDSQGVPSFTTLGSFFSNTGDSDSITGINLAFPFNNVYVDGEYGLSVYGGTIYMSIGDWLSTTSTIIVMILLCIVFGLMVRWLFRLTSGLIQGRG